METKYNLSKKIIKPVKTGLVATLTAGVLLTPLTGRSSCRKNYFPNDKYHEEMTIEEREFHYGGDGEGNGGDSGGSDGGVGGGDTGDTGHYFDPLTKKNYRV